MRRLLLSLLLACLPLTGTSAFERVTAENFAGDDFVFPQSIAGPGPHLLFLAMGLDQKNGEYQGDELIRWHRALEGEGVLPQAATPWHFAIMESPPFFVKGVIRRAIAKNYADLLPPGQGAVLFIKDIKAFAAAAGVPADGQPTLVVYTPAGGVAATVRGDVSAAGLATLVAALSADGAPAVVGTPAAPAAAD